MPSPSPAPAPPATDQPILFRPSKKRKLYRQRDVSPSPPPSSSITGDAPAPAPAPAAPQSLDELIARGADAAGEEDPAGASSSSPPGVVTLAEILRLRKQQRRARAVDGRHGGGGEEGEGQMVLHGGEDHKVEEGEGAGVVRRFAPQTGVLGKGDVDRHMMAYIDSELAKRRRREEGTASAAASAGQPPLIASTTTSTVPSSTSPLKDRNKGGDLQRQPAALGKLLEIDLGDEARDRNVQRTNQARRRMDGEVIEDDEEPPNGKGKGKVRLGRDGKPWRGRKRRASEDIKRDKLVEEFLRENRLDIYDEIPAAPTTTDDGQAADDVIAEAFRKEFMDAVSQRQRKKAVPAQPAPRGPGGKKEEELKGPKLGGSRSARAAMRETLLKNAKK